MTALLPYTASSASGQGVQSRLHPATARALSILELSFPYKGEVANVQVSISTDGTNFRPADVGLPRPWQVVWSSFRRGDRTTVIVPIGVRFQDGTYQFREPGTISVRSTVAIAGDDSGGLRAEQDFVITQGSAADTEFAERMDDDKALARLLKEPDGRDSAGATPLAFDNPEARAVAMVERFMNCARRTDVGSMSLPPGNLTEVADRLMTLVDKSPESSFAPYASHYAGCCYLLEARDRLSRQIAKDKQEGRLADESSQGKRLFAFFRADLGCAAARKAFQFASAKGDAYLKPRALYQLAVEASYRGDLDAMQDFLTKTEQEAPDSKQLAPMIDRQRQLLRENRQRIEQVSTGSNAP